jgi:hypothetical protein
MGLRRRTWGGLLRGLAVVGAALPGFARPAVSPGTVSSIDHLVWSPSPVAATGSLAAGQLQFVTVTAYDSSNNPLPAGTTVYLSLTGPGSLNAPANCGGLVGSTPVACTTEAGGMVETEYSAANPLRNGGSATLTAASDSQGANAATDTYSYSSFSELTLPWSARMGSRVLAIDSVSSSTEP